MSNANGSLSTVNDAIPELQETFTIEIVSAIGATIGSPSTMVIVIKASDDPYGSVQFIQVCMYNSLHYGNFHFDMQASVMLEETESFTTVDFVVVRSFGSLGRIVVTWQVSFIFITIFVRFIFLKLIYMVSLECIITLARKHTVVSK